MTKKEFQKADTRLRRRLGLATTTDVILPSTPSRTWVVRLAGLTEEQAAAVVTAAVVAGVHVE